MSIAAAFADLAGELALLLLRATLLMGAAWAAAAALRMAGASAAARHLAWLLGIAALLALPVLWWLAPVLRLPILPAGAAAEPPPVMAPEVDLAVPLSSGAAIDPGWGVGLLIVYALGVAALLLRLAVGRRMLRRLWSEAEPVRDPAWEKLLAQLSSDMALPRRVELRIARGAAVPMTWGTLAPKLLLPAEASEWPPERRRLVLLHELAHVARRDSLSRSVASLACALYWLHPGAWFAARRMRMEQEHAADDHVLMAGGSPKAYALSLLHLARGPGAKQDFGQAAAMAGMYQLERRLVSITKPARRDRPGSLFLSSSALLAGCTTVFVAAGVPVSATPTPLGRLQAKPGAMASVPGRDSASGRAEDASAGAGHAQRVSTLPAASAGEDGLASERPSPEAREIAQARPPRRDGAAPSGSGAGQERSRDRPQPAAQVQPLSHYGWELQRRDSRLQLESPRASSPPTRLVLPAPPASASAERTGRPRWARNIPRIVRGTKPGSSTVSTSQGPLTLSWSIGGAGD
ncbi:MAG TPA: M56 family metallopeptidase [Allosphingosinicella sp.]|nr:M56 family metallopeptidase [Allosphingosinicella sp.]